MQGVRLSGGQRVTRQLGEGPKPGATPKFSYLHSGQKLFALAQRSSFRAGNACLEYFNPKLDEFFRYASSMCNKVVVTMQT